MKRSGPIQRKTPMPRGSGKPIRKVSKTNAKREATGEDKLCRGQLCYLAIPGCCRNDIATVVPCHSNQAKHGKGMGHKADDVYTVPGCRACHAEIDQGNRFTKAEKFGIWDDAYARWAPVREKLQEEK